MITKNKKSMSSTDSVYEEEIKNYKAVEQSESASIWPGLLTIVAGILLLGLNLFNIQFDGTPWPLFIIGPGALLLLPAFQLGNDQSSAGVTAMATGGAILAMIGILLAFMELVDHYESWAYAWTLLPASGAAGAMYANRFNRYSALRQTGPRFIQVMIIAFVGLAIFFEMFIFTGHARWWPILLIAIGVYLILRERR